MNIKNKHTDRSLICSKQNRLIRISYNIKDVFVNFKDNKIDKETIEGIAIESLIEKYNLTTDWINENWQWGGTDENGTFIGIIGRVSYGNYKYNYILRYYYQFT